MNLPEDHLSAPDALTDALLREHVRLGNLDDEGLLAAVRARTVARPLVLAEVPSFRPASQRPKRRATLREWVQVAAIVALSLTVLGLFLSQQKVKRVTGKTHQLMVVSVPDKPSLRVVIQDQNAEPEPPKAGLITAADIRAAVLAEFSVSAESESEIAPGLVVYEGGVVLRHSDFVLKADRLELNAAGAESDSPVRSFTASGGDVSIEKRTTDGVVEVARADRATYEARGGRLVLTGGASLSTSQHRSLQPYTVGGEIELQPR